MDDTILNQFLLKVLDYYDKQNENNIEYIYSKNININIKDNNEIIISKKKFNFELLGYIDNNTHFWSWSWILPQYNMTDTKNARELLNYGLKLEPETNTNEQIFIKSLLVNSKILIESEIQLSIYLAIFSFLLNERIKFILPYKLNDKNNNLTLYYLIK